MKQIDAGELKRKLLKEYDRQHRDGIFFSASQVEILIDSMPDLSKPKRQEQITVDVNGVKVEFWFEAIDRHSGFELCRLLLPEEIMLDYIRVDNRTAEILAEIMGLKLPE